MEKIHFVILTWNSEQVIGRCIDSISGLTTVQADIYVVDNGSSDYTREIIARKIDDFRTQCTITLIANKKNIGTAIGRNIALRKIMEASAPEDYIGILDSDTEINDAAIHELMFVLKKDPRNAIAGPQMILKSGEIQVSAREIPTIKEKVLNVLLNRRQTLSAGSDHAEQIEQTAGYLLSACWLVKESVFRQIGLLNENFFYAPEDVEFCIRVWENGMRVLFCPRAKILHHWQRISHKKLFSKHNFEHLKGLLYIAWKYDLWTSNKHIKKLIF